MPVVVVRIDGLFLVRICLRQSLSLSKRVQILSFLDFPPPNPKPKLKPKAPPFSKKKNYINFPSHTLVIESFGRTRINFSIILVLPPLFIALISLGCTTANTTMTVHMSNASKMYRKTSWEMR